MEYIDNFFLINWMRSCYYTFLGGGKENMNLSLFLIVQIQSS